MRDVLGARFGSMVRVATNEATDPTVDSQIVQLQASDADVLICGVVPRFAAQAIRRAHDIGWQLMMFMTNVSVPVGVVMQPAGPEKAVGLMISDYRKDQSDPAWANDAGMNEWRGFVRRYFADGDLGDNNYTCAYGVGTTMIQALRQCGNDFPRENVMRQATNIAATDVATLLPGIKVQTQPTNDNVVRQMQLQRWDGTSWVRFGNVIEGANVGWAASEGGAQDQRHGLHLVLHLFHAGDRARHDAKALAHRLTAGEAVEGDNTGRDARVDPVGIHPGLRAHGLEQRELDGVVVMCFLWRRGDTQDGAQQIGAADQADQLAALEDEHAADMVLLHQLGDALGALRLADGDELPGHHVARCLAMGLGEAIDHRLGTPEYIQEPGERSGGVVREATDQVALGHDAHRRAFAIHHRNGGYATRGQQLRNGRDGRLRRDDHRVCGHELFGLHGVYLSALSGLSDEPFRGLRVVLF